MFGKVFRLYAGSPTPVTNKLAIVMYSRPDTILFTKNVKWDEKLLEIPTFPVTKDLHENVLSICEDYYGYKAQEVKPICDFYHGNERFLCYSATNKVPMAERANFVERSLLNIKGDIFEGYKYRDAVTLTIVQNLLIHKIDQIAEGDYSNRKLKISMVSLLIGFLIGAILIILQTMDKTPKIK